MATELEDEAWRWLDRHDERSYSFVDATSFAVMRRRGVSEALAFGEDFSAAGLVELRPSVLWRPSLTVGHASTTGIPAAVQLGQRALDV